MFTDRDLAALLQKNDDYIYLSKSINESTVPGKPTITSLGIVIYLLDLQAIQTIAPSILIKYINYNLFLILVSLRLIEKTKSPTIYKGASGIDYQIGGYNINAGWPSVKFIPVNDPNNNVVSIVFQGVDLDVFKNFFTRVSYLDYPCRLENYVSFKSTNGLVLRNIKKKDFENIL